MPSFSDVAAALVLPDCCMRKNPTRKQQLYDDVRMLGVCFSLYLISYFMGYHSLCLLSIATMNTITFQVGISFHELYSKPIHLNQFEELDSSMEEDDLSLKQKEHGATLSNPVSEEQENKVNEQLQRVVEETGLRNRKRASVPTARTPSSTTLADDEYKDMPPLVSQEEVKPTRHSLMWSEVPNFSQTHYLHNYMDEVD